MAGTEARPTTRWYGFSPSAYSAITRSRRMIAKRFTPVLFHAALGLFCTLTSTRAFAYAEDVHFQLVLRGLAGSGLSDVAGPANLVTAGAVRSAIDNYARRSPSLHDAWVKRYPSPG